MGKAFLNAAMLAALIFCQAAFAQNTPSSVMADCAPRATTAQQIAPRAVSRANKAGVPSAPLAGLVLKTKQAPPLALNIYGSSTWRAPKNFEGDIAADSSYAFSYGFKLDFGALDSRFFNSCSKRGGADFWSIKSFGDYEAVFNKRRWSVSLDLSKFSGELSGSVALGSLKFYSQKRDRPFSVSLSPFAASVGDAGGMSASLPTKSSSAQPDAIYADVSLKTVKNFSTETVRFMPLRAQLGVCKNESDPDKAPFFLAADGGFFYMNFLKVTGGFSFRRSYFEEKSVAAADWIEEIPVWKSELLNAASADLAIEIPHLKSRATFGIAESMASLGRWTLAQEFLTRAGAFSLSAALFASDNIFSETKTPYTAANAVEYKKLWQAKIAPQFDFKLAGGRRLKIGAAALLEERLVDYEKKTEHNSLEARFSAGFQIAGTVNAFRLVGTSGAAVLRQTPAQETVTPLPKASVTAAFSHNFSGGRGGRLSVTCGASFQPEFYWEKREWTERLKVCYYPRSLFLTSVSAGFEASQKEDKRKFEPSASANFLFKLKGLRLNASVTAQFPLGG